MSFWLLAVAGIWGPAIYAAWAGYDSGYDAGYHDRMLGEKHRHDRPGRWRRTTGRRN